MEKNSLEDIPVEVYQAMFILSKPYVGQESLNKAKEIVLKNKNYFPTYYNFFTANKEKLDKYYDELNELKGIKNWKAEDTFKKSNFSGGLWAAMKERTKIIKPKPITKEDIRKMFKSMEEAEEKRRVLKNKEEKLFQKYFGK